MLMYGLYCVLLGKNINVFMYNYFFPFLWIIFRPNLKFPSFEKKSRRWKKSWRVSNLKATWYVLETIVTTFKAATINNFKFFVKLEIYWIVSRSRRMTRSRWSDSTRPPSRLVFYDVIKIFRCSLFITTLKYVAGSHLWRHYSVIWMF